MTRHYWRWMRLVCSDEKPRNSERTVTSVVNNFFWHKFRDWTNSDNHPCICETKSHWVSRSTSSYYYLWFGKASRRWRTWFQCRIRFGVTGHFRHRIMSINVIMIKSQYHSFWYLWCQSSELSVVTEWANRNGTASWWYCLKQASNEFHQDLCLIYMHPCNAKLTYLWWMSSNL